MLCLHSFRRPQCWRLLAPTLRIKPQTEFAPGTEYEAASEANYDANEYPVTHGRLLPGVGCSGGSGYIRANGVH